MKKTILVRGVDDEAYRRAKAVAVMRGVPIGSAVSEALAEWAKESKRLDIDQEVKADRAFVRRSWDKLKVHKGKAVVVEGGKLRGVFEDYDTARSFSTRFGVALTFVVGAPPEKSEFEIGPELEV